MMLIIAYLVVSALVTLFYGYLDYKRTGYTVFTDSINLWSDIFSIIAAMIFWPLLFIINILNRKE